MRTITFEFPDEIGATEFDTRMRVAVALYNEEVLLMSECAALVGLTKREFLTRSAAYGGLKMGPQTPEELEADLATLDRWYASRHLGR